MKLLRLFVLLFFTTLNACTLVQPLEVKSVVCCDIQRALKTETEIAFVVHMYNPNEFPVNIKSYCLDMKLNGAVLGTAKSKTLTEIQPYSELKQSVTVKTTPNKLMSGGLMMGLGAFLNNDMSQIDIEVAGSVVGNAKGISKRVRIREKYPLRLNF